MNHSKVIKKRLQKAKASFAANNNIAEYLEEGDIELLLDEAEKAYGAFMDALLIEREKDPNSSDTPRRVAKMYLNEIMRGRYSAMPKVTSFPNEDNGSIYYDGMLVTRAPITSLCSHHHQPINGSVWVGIIPENKVLGLSKYARIIDWIGRRGILQEAATMQIHATISDMTECSSVAVYMEAKHGCCENRGIGIPDSTTQTVKLSGSFLNSDAVRSEFYQKIKMAKSVV